MSQLQGSIINGFIAWSYIYDYLYIPQDVKYRPSKNISINPTHIWEDISRNSGKDGSRAVLLDHAVKMLIFGCSSRGNFSFAGSFAGTNTKTLINILQ